MLSVSGYDGVVLKEYDDDNRRRLADELETYLVVHPGQLVINTMWLNFRGLGVAEHTGVVSPAYRAYSLGAAWNPRFVHYLLRTDAYVSEYTRLAYGIRPNSLVVNREDFGSLRVPVPSREDQLAIADFLDNKTAAIDALIAKKERLIELLQEKRQGLITQAVTKGLDPSVPMKDSGVEWLGEIPAHWRIVKLAWVARIISGSTPNRANAGYWQDGVVPWLASGKVNDYLVTQPSELISNEAVTECGLRLAPVGAVVIGLVGQGRTRGMSARLGIAACINQNMAAIVPESELQAAYLHGVLQHGYEPIREIGQGANQEALNREIVANLRVPLPPEPEQIAIGRRLDALRDDTDRSLSMIARQSELLREYRQALITAAVTGQLDIAQEAARDPEPVVLEALEAAP